MRPEAGEPSARSRLDLTLIIIVLALVAGGLPMVVSATSGSPNGAEKVWRQVVGFAVGSLLGAGIVAAPVAWLRRAILPVYLTSLVLLFLVVTPLGRAVKGARRWIEIGDLQFQPSELARFAVILILADYLAKNRGRLADTLGVGVPGLALAVVPMIMMVPQKDFGSIVILLGLTGVMFYVAGLHWRQLAPSALVAGLGATALILNQQYRIDRLNGFFDPFNARIREGYQVIEGWIALASGGWFGAGYTNGLAQHGRLPEPHTDFIAAVIAEEWGATGLLLLVVVQWLLVWRSTHLALRAKDLFGNLAGVGITAMFGAQAVVNLSAVVGLLPPKGLVLPFVSYGASAMVIHAASAGLLLKIGMSQEVDPVNAPERGWTDWRPIGIRKTADGGTR